MIEIAIAAAVLYGIAGLYLLAICRARSRRAGPRQVLAKGACDGR